MLGLGRVSSQGHISVNVREKVREIHSNVERNHSAVGPRAESAVESATIADLGSLRNAYERLYSARHMVGGMPPSPATLRGRTGRHLVTLVQRMLFWYTPQIHRFQDEATNLLDGTLRIIEQQSALIESLRKDVTALRRDLWAGHGESAPAGKTEETGEKSLPASFEFALQNHFRGSETNTEAKLGIWLEALTDLSDTHLRQGTWLDIGCGRGEWLGLVTKAGIHAVGIDPSPAAVAHCRGANLAAERVDAVTWLKSCPDASLAVISAFHVVEHLPVDALLHLVQLAVQKLQPRGVIAIETPNPANLPMGAHHFWNDPTHQRPVPPALLKFIFEYFGLKVLRQLELNPCPDQEHLPFTEIDVIRQVDQHLYGPQDYGLIGRRE